MKEREILKKAEHFVKEKSAGESSGHDWWHIYCVLQLTKKISKTEKADPFVVEMAALLHDIADWKFSNSEQQELNALRNQMLEWGVLESYADRIMGIIQNVSYKGAGVETPMTTIEGMIVQDADRLDALGAVGIARAFAYGGKKGRLMYDPDAEPAHHSSFEEYKNSNSSSVNHFYEKLLLLKDRMNTRTGRSMAKKRHRFMESYLKEFYKEWKGKK